MTKQPEAAGGYRKIPISAIEPNPWNPNKMPGALFSKLVRNVEETLKKDGRIPPIVVRPHPTDKGRFQIIDGWHRYKALKQLKHTEADSFVMNVDDEAAKLLTANLNYLRGEKDPLKYTTLITEMMQAGTTLDRLADFLPEDSADINDLITTYGDGAAIRSMIEAQDAAGERNSEVALKDDNVFVELRFHVSVSQGKVIQREIDRIGKALTGNNIEGRALEFMAVQSSQTELPADLAPPPEEPKPEAKRKDMKSKMQDKLKKLRGVA